MVSHYSAVVSLSCRNQRVDTALHLLPQVFQARIRMTAAINKKKEPCVEHLMSYSAIFSVFLLFYLKFTLSDKLIAVKSLC